MIQTGNVSFNHHDIGDSIVDEVHVSPWDRLLEQPSSRGHFVQLYEADEVALARNVGLYLWEGLRRGEGAVVIATPEHVELFSAYLNRLGADLPALLGAGQLVFEDAQATLARIVDTAQPDWRRFEKVVRQIMRKARPAGKADGLRAYGEMVGILWKARQFAAAIRLEQLWNKLLEHSSFSLYCAYAIDVFGKDFEVANLEGVLCAHTHLVPAQTDGTLETALNLSIDEVFGAKAPALRVLIKENHQPAWAVMPAAENILLWLRKNVPQQVDEIVERTRHHYRLLSQSAA